MGLDNLAGALAAYRPLLRSGTRRPSSSTSARSSTCRDGSPRRLRRWPADREDRHHPGDRVAELVDLLLGLEGVLYATDAAAEDEDPVIDPDGCSWIASGIERFVATAPRRTGEAVAFEGADRRSPAGSLLGDGRLAEQQLRWLESGSTRCATRSGDPPQWKLTCAELGVLAAVLPALRRARGSPSTPTRWSRSARRLGAVSASGRPGRVGGEISCVSTACRCCRSSTGNPGRCTIAAGISSAWLGSGGTAGGEGRRRGCARRFGSRSRRR